MGTRLFPNPSDASPAAVVPLAREMATYHGLLERKHLGWLHHNPDLRSASPWTSMLDFGP